MMTPSPPKVIPATTALTTTTERTTTPETTEAPTTTTTEQTTTTQMPTTTTTEATTTTTVPTTTTTEPTTTTTVKTTTTTPKPTTTTPRPTTTTPAPTTTTKATTTTTRRTTTTTRKPTTTTPDPSDRRFSATASFHLPDLLQAGTPVYRDGPVAVSEEGPETLGPAADFGVNDEEPERSCLKVNDLSKAGATSEAHMKCWKNPANCKAGFSAVIWAKIMFKKKDKTKRYLFSTGGYEDGTPGVSVYYKGIYIYAVVATGEAMWSIHAPGAVFNDTWSSIGFSWGPKDGLELYINGKRKAFVKYPDAIPPPKKPPLKPLQLTLGCRRIKKEVYEDFVIGMLDEFATWQYRIPPSDSDYFLGGLDPSKLCKPEKHPFACSTDMETLLKKIDETDMSDLDIALTTISHAAELVTSMPDPGDAGSTQSGSGADGKGGSSYDEDSKDKKDGDDAEENSELDNLRLGNLRNLIALVKKLVNKTSGSLNPSPEDLGVLYKVQEIVNIIMSESNAKLWKQIQKEGEDGIGFINSVQDWSTKKLVESTTKEKNVDLLLISDNMATRSQKSSAEEIKEKHKPYIYFPDYAKDEKWQKLKKLWRYPNDQIRVSTNIFDDSEEEVSIHSVLYKTFHKFASLHNSITGGNSSGVFLDSRVISFEVKPSYKTDVLRDDPVIVFLEHQLEKTKDQRSHPREKLQEPKIDTWECVRWSKTLEIGGRAEPGGWTTEGCAKINSTSQYTTCACGTLGMFALMAVLEKPKEYVEPEDETWVFAMRGLGYSFSIIVLICYISAIALRTSLHDQFHIIRLNLSIATVGTMICLFSVDFKRHDWEACRVLAGFIHYFFLVMGCWLAILTHALFKGFIRGIVEGRICFYLLVGWGLPLVYVGVVVASSPNYGYDDRCMVGPTRGMRCSLACPLVVFGMGSLVWSTVICCNLSSPQIKRIEVVEELNASTKMLFCVSLCFSVIWIIGVVALLELDASNVGGWRRLYQIFNSWLGLPIVFFLGFGSKHFRHAVFEKYVKYLNFFPNNRIEPSRLIYTNGYRFDFKYYYY